TPWSRGSSSTSTSTGNGASSSTRISSSDTVTCRTRSPSSTSWRTEGPAAAPPTTGRGTSTTSPVGPRTSTVSGTPRTPTCATTSSSSSALAPSARIRRYRRRWPPRGWRRSTNRRWARGRPTVTWSPTPARSRTSTPTPTSGDEGSRSYGCSSCSSSIVWVHEVSSSRPGGTVTLVAGVDSSTQACKIEIRDLASGALVRQGRAPHPHGTEVDPQAWWRALMRAAEDAGGLADVAAVSIAGQQHGMVPLDARGTVIRPALLWNDNRSAQAAADLVAEVGAQTYARRTGSVPVASFTCSK